MNIPLMIPMLQCFFASIILISTAAVVSAQRQGECCQAYCYDLDNERPQSAHFGTKTAYLIAKGPESGRQYKVPNCEPTKMWLYARHGTRLPTKKDIGRLPLLEDLRDEIIGNYEKRHTKPPIGAMCENDLDLLKQWHWNRNITAQYEQFLTVQGWEELKFLAIRYQRVFKNIWQSAYNPVKFSFRYANSQRTEASFRAFVEGLFGPNAYQTVNVPPPAVNDTLLKPYAMCPPHEMYDSTGPETEYGKFIKSRTIMQLLSDVSQRLGFKFVLKLEQVLDMFNMCRYDQAWMLDRPSPWCAAFTPSQVDDIEYLLDLDTYYAHGYGNELNKRLACAAVNDMIHHMDTTNEPNAVAYFTHSESVEELLSALQAVKDSDTLRADNYYSMSRRKWRTSEIAPFASNFAAVKYSCPNEVQHDKVMFFLNEKPLYFDWCKVGLCDLSDIKVRYKEYTEVNCDEYFCSGYNAANSLYTHGIYVLAIPIIVATLFSLATYS